MAKGKVVVDSLGKIGELLGGTTAERMARAAEQGYALDYPLSHANESGVIEGGAFDLSRAGKNYPVSWGDAVYLGDRGLASNYGEQTGEYYLRNPEYVSARDALRKGYENDKTDQSFDEWMEGIEDSFGLYGWMEQGFEFNLDDAIKAGKDGVIVDFSGTPAKEKYVAFTKNPAAIRSINADFNPEYKDSSNLLAGVSSLAPYLGAGALAAGAMAPEDAEAAAIDQAYNDYLRDELEANTAADTFTQMRSRKAGYWEQRRQDLLDMVDGLGELANDVVLPALDMPLQGYLGLTGAAGALASGQGFDQAIARGAQIARQPSDATTYQLGGAVNDALSPYLPDEAAAAAGALLHGGVQVFAP